MAGTRQLDQPGGDVLLHGADLTAALPDVLEARIGTAQGQRLRCDQRVVQHVVRARQQLASSHSKKVGVARAGADHGDAARAARRVGCDLFGQAVRVGGSPAAQERAQI